ncbi:COG4223 family protein [Shinella sp. BYT-45]|uniref:COG4223 family protein n=1 Tax=Shinella sp. BYT-45 TaxID=3377377 RepID=UPI0039815553
MEPETPSRRKKAGDKPVTIDLEAVPASASNEALAAEQKAEDDASAPDTEVTQASAAETAPTEAAATQTETETAEERRETVEPARATYEEPVRAATPPPQRGNAGTLAAGILGGLIALLGAGSLQYGGYLPALGPGRADDTGAVTALSNEIEALKTRLSETAAASPVDLQPIEMRIAALEESAREGTAAPGADPEALGKLEGDVTRLTTELAALREALARTTEAVSTTESQLAERLAAAEQKLEEPRSDIEMARAVAASALKTAIDRGGPYLAELEAFASIAPDDPSLAGLREHAAVGVSSRADLVRDFHAVADAILDAVHQPEGDQGVISRLMSSAASAIRVRPVGSVEGDTPEAIVARIENKLQNGDFKGAQIEWRTLPEKGQGAATEYKRKLDERVGVEDLIGAVVSGALNGTTTSTPNQG